ncbi:MAG: hypothetical protein CL693_18395 [Cellvibrionaceae bacterium]|nr:hypothetical protein [Cellvibrionaceae bacterium]|tara:strand:+ start:9909 stop:10328 length:420 start_codon:yes stop_codon:yes gene_type:complete
MNRKRLLNSASGLLLFLAILTIPDIFLFAKTVPNSFWTEYFPLPFGAGWFVAFICLVPATWAASFSRRDLMHNVVVVLLVVFLVVIMAVPIALATKGLALSLNNLINQYLWVSIMCFPPLIVQLSLRLAHRFTTKFVSP